MDKVSEKLSEPSAPPSYLSNDSTMIPPIANSQLPPQHPQEVTSELLCGNLRKENVQNSALAEPPPSYQAAMAYPVVSGPNAHVPENPHFPKQNYGGVQLPPCYNPLPPVLNEHYLPPSSLTTPVSVPVPPAQIIVNVRDTRPVTGNCTYCRVGEVVKETDLCCLLCLIILGLFTFPIGLLFLCCIPCTVHQRCRHCRRMG